VRKLFGNAWTLVRILRRCPHPSKTAAVFRFADIDLVWVMHSIILFIALF
jgi:hypothetical protein